MISIRLWLLLGLVPFLAFGGSLYGSGGEEGHNMAGIGVAVGADDPTAKGTRLRDHLVVRSVLDRGPAQKAGIMAGDEIVEIDGQKLAGMKVSDAVENHLRGPLRSPVKITIVRPGQSQRLSFALLRDIVPVPGK